MTTRGAKKKRPPTRSVGFARLKAGASADTFTTQPRGPRTRQKPKKSLKATFKSAAKKQQAARPKQPRTDKTKTPLGPGGFRMLARDLSSKALAKPVKKILKNGNHPNFMKAFALTSAYGYGLPPQSVAIGTAGGAPLSVKIEMVQVPAKPDKS